MKAVLSRAYSCAPEGHTVIKFEAGTEVDGEIARMALADGAALEIREIDFETKVKAPTDSKVGTRKKSKKE